MARLNDILIRFTGKDDGAAATSNRVAASLDRLARSLQKTGDATNKAANSNVGIANTYKGLVGQVASLNKGINIFGATIRQIGQGLQNLGTTVTAFVSAPAALIGASSLKTILAFDDLLIDVRKNAGLTTTQMEDLRQGIMALAQSTPTSLEELTQIADAAGRLGLGLTATPVENILGFIKVVDQLQVATNLTAADAAEQIGRIANIFFDQERLGMDYTQFLTSLGSAINVLGQNIAGTESEIVAATLRAAPAAAAIGMAVEDVIAIAATLVESSASAERAGTQLNRALSETATNLDEMAESFGLASDELKALITENPAEAFFAIAESIASIENPVDRVAAATELFGEVGAKAVNILGQATINAAKSSDEFSKLAENVALSRKAFYDAVSLQIEFDRALDSVTNQLKILQNNFRVLAVTIGEAVLPPLTKILTFAIPIVKILTELFDQAGDRAKLMAVGFVLLAAVIGPLLFALGSLLFSLGIITTGLTTFMLQIFGLIVLPARLAAALVWVINPMRILAAAAAVAAVALFGFRGDIQATVSYIASVASQMYSWGYGMFSSFADGIAAAASEIYRSVLSILNTIASFIRSFSPPKAGPLKHIDVWGRNLATTFARAFSEGDLSGVVKFAGLIGTVLESSLRSLSGSGVGLFSDISQMISSAISALAGATSVEDKGASQSNIALEKLAALLLAVEEGGSNVSQLMSELGDSLGQFGEDFQKLIGLQFEYNEANKQLEAIKERLERFDEETNQAIAGIAQNTELTVEQRSALIRSAKISAAAEKKLLQEQEKAAESNVELIEAQISAQKDLIAIITDLLRAQEKLNETVDGGSGDDAGKPPKAGDESALDLPALDLEGVTSQLDKAGTAIEEWSNKASEDFATFSAKVASAEEIVRGFIAGITGNLPTEAMGEGFWRGFLVGNDIRLKVLGFLKQVTDYKDKLSEIGEAFAEGFGVVKWAFIRGLTNDLVDIGLLPDKSTLVGWLSNVALQAGLALSGLVGVFDEVKTAQQNGLPSPLDPILKQLETIDKAFLDALDFDTKITPRMNALKGPLGSIVESLGIVAALSFFSLDELAGILGKILLYSAVGVGFLVGVAGALTEIINIAAGRGNVDRLSDAFVLMGDDAETARKKAIKLKDSLEDMVKTLSGGGDSLGALKTFFTDIGLAPEAAGLMAGAVSNIAESVRRLKTAVEGPISENISNAITNIGQAWDKWGKSGFAAFFAVWGSIALQINIDQLTDIGIGFGNMAEGISRILNLDFSSAPAGEISGLGQAVKGTWGVVNGIIIDPWLNLAGGIARVYGAAKGWDSAQIQGIEDDIRGIKRAIDEGEAGGYKFNWFTIPKDKADEADRDWQRLGVAIKGFYETLFSDRPFAERQGAIKEIFGALQAGAENWDVALFAAIAGGIAGIMESIALWSSEKFRAFEEDLNSATTAARNFASTLSNNASQNWQSFITDVRELANNSKEGLSTTFKLFGDKLGLSLVSGLNGTIVLASSSFASKLMGIVPEEDATITDVFRAYGKKLGNTIKNAFLSVFGDLSTDIQNAINTALKDALSNLGEVASFVSDPIGYIQGQLSGGSSQAGNSAFSDITAGLTKTLGKQKFAEQFREVGVASVDGLNEGVEEKKQSFWDKTVELGQDGLDGILSFFRIRSPSGTTRDRVGIPIVDGIIQGLELRITQLRSAFEDAAARIVDYIENQIIRDLLPVSKYDNILNSLVLWVRLNADPLRSLGADIGRHINDGISEALNDQSKFNSIRSAFVSWSSSLGSDDPMFGAARSIGRQLMGSVGEGIEDPGVQNNLFRSIYNVIIDALRDAIKEATKNSGGGGSGSGNSGSNSGGGSSGGDSGGNTGGGSDGTTPPKPDGENPGGPGGTPKPVPTPFSAPLSSITSKASFGSIINDLAAEMASVLNTSSAPSLVVNVYGAARKEDADAIAKSVSEELAKNYRATRWARR